MEWWHWWTVSSASWFRGLRKCEDHPFLRATDVAHAIPVGRHFFTDEQRSSCTTKLLTPFCVLFRVLTCCVIDIEGFLSQTPEILQQRREYPLPLVALDDTSQQSSLIWEMICRGHLQVTLTPTSADWNKSLKIEKLENRSGGGRHRKPANPPNFIPK